MTVIKTKELLDSVPALRELNALDVPVKLAFTLKRNMKRITTEIEIADELRKKIVEKYTKKDDKGEIVRPLGKDGKPDPNMVTLTDPAAFSAEIKELNEVEAKMTLVEISEADFGENVKLKSGMLSALHWLFAEEK